MDTPINVSSDFIVNFITGIYVLTNLIIIFGLLIKKVAKDYIKKDHISLMAHDLSLTGKHTSPVYCGIRPNKKDLHELAWELYTREVYNTKKKACFLTKIKVKNISLLRYVLEERLGETNIFCRSMKCCTLIKSTLIKERR